MRLQPFVSVDEVPFSVTREQILQLRGRPARELRNDVGLHELDYGNIVFRFQDSGRLEEITAEAAVVSLESVAIPFRALEPFIRSNDASAFERAGFIVSPRFGFAFDPNCPSWVTALAAHCIGTWRSL